MAATKPKINVISSLLKGFSSVFNLSGQTFLDMPDFSGGFQRDGAALRGDWQRVGDDLKKAMERVANER
jgi:hypothetical protein